MKAVFAIVTLLVVAPLAVSAGDYCAECISVVGALETQGTDMACKYLHMTQPPESTLCQLIVDKLGSYIDQHLIRGDNATTICKDTGFCSSQGCVCGECQAPVYNLRCLGLDAKCPSAQATAPTTQLRGFADSLTAANVPASPDAGFCITPMCGPSHVGCCLTCF